VGEAKVQTHKRRTVEGGGRERVPKEPLQAEIENIFGNQEQLKRKKKH
jgi:hypothetical protein